eukprot:TRINITY_DN21958_c0_g1_i1.p1 TRINITY_DN21958_c0_g1~~TRINITY_DN21958_c0_g1_i1.p1  ORF type:complete len:327 (-),score=42.06 TRINITY_DN21958_c0_g1_i1:13-993(-)
MFARLSMKVLIQLRLASCVLLIQAAEAALKFRSQEPLPTTSSTLFLSKADVASYRPALDKYLAPGGEDCIDYDASDAPLPKGLGTCAVVGASPNSEGSNAGTDIDNHAAVFRAGICDKGTLQKHRKDIGDKTEFCVSFNAQEGMEKHTKIVMPLTTWHYLSNIGAGGSSAKCKKQYLLVHPRQIARWDARLTSVATSLGIDLAPWRKTSNYYDPDCLASPKTADATKCPAILPMSSGFDAVLLALELCQHVDVYGFDTDESPDAPYGHLHNDVESVNASPRMGDHSHPFPLERRLLKQWHADGALKLHNSTLQPSKLGRHAQDSKP